jgi:hypothetical protein
MRKATIRATLWLLGGLLLSGIVGCGADEQTEIIAATNARLDDVIGKLTEISGQLKKAVDVSKEKNALIKADDKNLFDAIETAKELRKLGERLQRIKEFSDRAKDKTSPEYSKELLESSRRGIQERLVRLEKEEKALREVLAQARERAEDGSDRNRIYGKQKLADLEKELKSGRDAFELLTKQR